LFPDLSRYIVSAILFVLSVPLPLLADDLRLIPGVAFKEELNDNIYLATTSRRTDFITTITPSLDITDASELRSITLSTGVNFLRYANTTGLDSEDFYGQGGFNYSFDPRFTVAAGAGYVQDSRPDRTDQGGLTIKSGSNRQNCTLSGNYGVSDRSTATLAYAYSLEEFDNPALLSTTVHTVSFGQDYKIESDLRQAKLVGNLGYSRNLTDSSQVDNFTASIGLSKKINELWNVSINAGGRFTHSESIVSNQIVSEKLRSDDQGWIGNLSLNYSDETTSGSLTFNNDVIAASGRSGTTERTGGTTRLSRKFARGVSGFISLAYSWNRSNQGQVAAQSIDEQSLNFGSGLRYDISDYVSLEGNYNVKTIYNGTASSETNQNVFVLRLTMRRDVLDL
jgi:hypothetical protein